MIMPTLAETWRAEGWAKGWAEGLAKGRAQGLAESRARILRIVLERRFGELPPEAEARIDAATSEELKTWIEKACDAGALDEVFESVPAH